MSKSTDINKDVLRESISSGFSLNSKANFYIWKIVYLVLAEISEQMAVCTISQQLPVSKRLMI